MEGSFTAVLQFLGGGNTKYPLGPHREALELVKIQGEKVAVGKHLLWLMWEGVAR